LDSSKEFSETWARLYEKTSATSSKLKEVTNARCDKSAMDECFIKVEDNSWAWDGLDRRTASYPVGEHHSRIVKDENLEKILPIEN
jgi:hypothetical protein